MKDRVNKEIRELDESGGFVTFCNVSGAVL